LNTLEGDPREMRSAVVYEFHGVNPVQLGREERGRSGEIRFARHGHEFHGVKRSDELIEAIYR